MRQFRRYATKLVLTALACAMLLTTTVAAAKIGDGTITASSLRVREQASTSSATLTLIPNGTTVEILAEEGEWYLTSYSGFMGYIHRDYVDYVPIIAADAAAELAVSIVSDSAAPEEEAAASAAQSLKQSVVDAACSYLGVRYVYGGASPSGFDCSGFTMYIYRQFGYTLPHSATSQLQSCSVSVSKDELQMGDLMFFRDPSVTSKAASHVGIYIGGNKFVHAASRSTPYVVISDLSESYYARYYTGARRLITE